MIGIDRSGTPCPDKLRTAGEEDLLRVRALAGRGLLESDDFDRDIYGSLEVRTALWTVQHRKCCYCEREYERKYSGVEHFRPKTHALRDDGTRSSGYWWLAYRFDNLYFGCPLCNQAKGDHFPLAPGTRALVPEEDPRSVQEFPLLIDPGIDDPEAHLTFVWIPNRGFEIAPRNGSERGRRTIQVLALDRDDLSQIRHAYYQRCLEPLIRRFKHAKGSGDEHALAEIRLEAEALQAPGEPFALLARVALRPILEPS